MVAIFIRRISKDTEMNRHDNRLNDGREEASLPRQGDGLCSRPPAFEQTAEYSRDHRELPGSATEASARVSKANASMSDISRTKSPSFEHRDEQRSAFSSLQSDEQTEEVEQAARMPHPVRSSLEEPHPYFQPQPHQADTDGQSQNHTYPYQHQGHSHYQSQNQYSYPSYYPPPDQESNSAAMSSGQYHPPYTSYGQHQHHPQGYGYHQQDYSQYSYYPSGASGQYLVQPYPYQNYPGATPPTPHSSQANTLREAPSAVTESTKGTPSLPARKSYDRYGQDVDLSQSPSVEEEDRKTSANEQQGRWENRGKEESPQQQHQDFEPIPLFQISAIPVLSSSSSAARKQPPLSQGASPQAFAQAFTLAAAASSAHVAPPIPNATPTPRPQSRILVPSSSGSNSSSTGGEGGSWEKRYAELCEFKRAHGHCEVPQNYTDNNSLGTWVNKQRMEQKNRSEGKNSSLNDSRLERLQFIGFRWAKRKGQASWNEKFNDLVQYKAMYGNCHVPTKYKANTALGRWVSTQRAEYKKYSEGQSKTTMTAERVQRLESIGFAWFMAI